MEDGESLLDLLAFCEVWILLVCGNSKGGAVVYIYIYIIEKWKVWRE